MKRSYVHISGFNKKSKLFFICVFFNIFFIIFNACIFIYFVFLFIRLCNFLHLKKKLLLIYLTHFKHNVHLACSEFMRWLPRFFLFFRSCNQFFFQFSWNYELVITRYSHENKSVFYETLLFYFFALAIYAFILPQYFLFSSNFHIISYFFKHLAIHTSRTASLYPRPYLFLFTIHFICIACVDNLQIEKLICDLKNSLIIVNDM